MGEKAIEIQEAIEQYSGKASMERIAEICDVSIEMVEDVYNLMIEEYTDCYNDDVGC